MDLGAFLPPGGNFLIKIQAGPPGRSGSAGDAPLAGHGLAEEIRGRVEEHRGRPFWLASGQMLCGQVLRITVEISGYDLGDDGSLTPGGPGALAYVALIGQVKNCRLIKPWRLYALRLKLLGRVWP
jgi:hypothetical protein